MIPPEPTSAIEFFELAEGSGRAVLHLELPAAGHLGVIEERCDLRHASEKAHLSEVVLPCPNCRAIQ